MISFTFSQVSSVEPSSTTTISVQEPICGTRRKHSWIFPASLWQGMTTEQESGGRATRGRAAMYWTEETKQSMGDRKSTRLNSSHGYISYAVFCLKKKTDSRFQHQTLDARLWPPIGHGNTRLGLPSEAG